MTDAAQWLVAHRLDRPCPEGRRNAPTKIEWLGPGDVTDDGAIVTDQGQLKAAGEILVEPRQVAAAEYYGWKPVVSVFNNGRIFMIMGRMRKYGDA